VNRSTGRFILRFGGAESKGGGQLQLGAVDVDFDFAVFASAEARESRCYSKSRAEKSRRDANSSY
jgi:hypothetical protein